MISKILSGIKKYWGWLVPLAILLAFAHLYIKNKRQENRINDLENQLIINQHEVRQQEIQDNVIKELKGNPDKTLKIIGGLVR